MADDDTLDWVDVQDELDGIPSPGCVVGPENTFQRRIFGVIPLQLPARTRQLLQSTLYFGIGRQQGRGRSDSAGGGAPLGTGAESRVLAEYIHTLTVDDFLAARAAMGEAKKGKGKAKHPQVEGTSDGRHLHTSELAALRELRDTMCPGLLTEEEFWETYKHLTAFLVQGGDGWELVELDWDTVSGNIEQEIDIPTSDFRFLLVKQAIPEELQEAVWRLLGGAGRTLRENPALYAEAIYRHLGDVPPAKHGVFPTFGGELRPQDHPHLPASKVYTVQRLLVVLGLERPDLTYAPAIPDLVCILLQSLPEADTFATVLRFVDLSQRGCSYLALSRRDELLFQLAFGHLLEKNAPSMARRLRGSGKSIDGWIDLDRRLLKETEAEEEQRMAQSVVIQTPLVSEWLSRLFVAYLPPEVVMRVFGLYMLDGIGALISVAVAVMYHFQDVLKASETVEDFFKGLRRLRNHMSPEDANEVLKVAFTRVYVTPTALSAFAGQFAQALEDVEEPQGQAFVRPHFSARSSIVDTADLEVLWGWLPVRHRLGDVRLRFDMSKDGVALSTLYEKCMGLAPSIILVQTASATFGAYLSEPWGVRQKKEFWQKSHDGGATVGSSGTGECFIFKLAPTTERWVWKSGQSTIFIRSEPSRLSIGGSAIVLDTDLKVWSGESETFASPSLLMGTATEECIRVEVLEVAC